MSTRDVIAAVDDIDWLPAPSRVIVRLTSELPPQELTTAAEVLLLANGRVLLVNTRRRGWDLPGGHIEPGESAVVAAARELEEEAGAAATSLRPLAVYELEVLRKDCPAGYSYPFPISYIVVFGGFVSSLKSPHVPKDDCMGRQLCDFSEAERLTDQKVWTGLLKTRDARGLAEQSYAGPALQSEIS